jgi:hypothetical protein
MVDAWGMPTFFLTLTADEISSMRWKEIDDVEKILRNIIGNLNWKDAPVKCAALFHAKVQAFMKDYILNAEVALLGKVNHYVLQYEEQNRGILHAHIILWVDAADQLRVSNEISAAIPADRDEVQGQFVPPQDPDALHLFELVSLKNQHKCRSDGCMKGKDHCRYGYPFKTQSNMEATFNAPTLWWEYFRPRYVDRNTVSYHPLVMLLWGAHCNVQWMTSTSWSFYVLKYAMKCEPLGKLNLDTDAAKQLGLGNISESQLKAINALTMSQPVSSTQAATAMLGIDTIIRSESVQSIYSTPPDLRIRYVTRSTSLYVPFVDRNCARPVLLEDITFTKYFSEYQIEKKAIPSRTFVEKDLLQGFVYSNKRVIRFTDYHPANHTKAYFYNVLLSKVPFKNENELLSPENTARSYFYKCRLKGLISSTEDLKAHIAAYAQCHL